MCNSEKAGYLFQPDKLNTELDNGDKTIQCGRKTDAVKLWLMWKGHGDKGLEHRVDHQVKLAKYMYDQLKIRPGFEVICDPVFTNVLFFYVPSNMRGCDLENNEKLGKVAPYIKRTFQEDGDILLGYQNLKSYQNVWRMVFVGDKDKMTTLDVDRILDRIQLVGEKYSYEISSSAQETIGA